MRAGRRRIVSLAIGVLGVWALLLAGHTNAGVAAPPPAATAPAMLVGASSPDWGWLDDAAGPAQIYRVFDSGGFHFATWRETLAYQKHPNATAFDYSFDVLPQRLTNPADPINAQIRAFLATTPKNLIITNSHEPDNNQHLFTPSQYRAGLLALAAMVRAQNTLDGGTRRTSLILMAITFTGKGSSTADDWWPNDARDGGHVDIIEADVYQWPHATNTHGVPAGYTDGVKWRSASALISPLRDFARAHGTPWAIAELGILEDVNKPGRRAAELSDAVAFARANGALHLCYFDNKGPRADWRLRWSTPVGSTSKQSAAVTMWSSLMARAGGPDPEPGTREWVGNPGLDNGSVTGWAASGPATSVSTEWRSGNWLLRGANQSSSANDVVFCSASPHWVGSTTAGTAYKATVEVMPSAVGTRAHLFLREVAPDGKRVGFAISPKVTVAGTTTLTPLPAVTLTAARSGNSIRMCVVGSGVAKSESLFADSFSLTSQE